LTYRLTDTYKQRYTHPYTDTHTTHTHTHTHTHTDRITSENKKGKERVQQRGLKRERDSKRVEEKAEESKRGPREVKEKRSIEFKREFEREHTITGEMQRGKEISEERRKEFGVRVPMEWQQQVRNRGIGVRIHELKQNAERVHTSSTTAKQRPLRERRTGFT
jgi:hypothetical protein